MFCVIAIKKMNYTFTNLNNMVVYQYGQIWGMSTFGLLFLLKNITIEVFCVQGDAKCK